MKKIEEFLPYYLNCLFQEPNGDIGAIGNINRFNNRIMFYPAISNYDCKNKNNREVINSDVKPILRKLESMTDAEKKESGITESVSAEGHERNWPFSCFHYLLSKGFDLFGLIYSGLAIDKATLK